MYVQFLSLILSHSLDLHEEGYFLMPCHEICWDQALCFFPFKKKNKKTKQKRSMKVNNMSVSEKSVLSETRTSQHWGIQEKNQSIRALNLQG